MYVEKYKTPTHIIVYIPKYNYIKKILTHIIVYIPKYKYLYNCIIT